MKDENVLIKEITEHLDQSVESLDPEILSKIRAARYNALERKRPWLIQWALPAGGLAIAALVLLVAINILTGPEYRQSTQITIVDKTSNNTEAVPSEDKTPPIENTDAEIQPGQIELVEILSSDQQLDLFENLEFYAWLSENENITG